MSNKDDSPFKSNPASGLPMLPQGGTDTAGNPYGLNFDREETWEERDMPSAFEDDPFDSFSSDW